VNTTVTSSRERRPEGRRAQCQYFIRREAAPVPIGRRLLTRVAQTCAAIAFVSLFLPSNFGAFTLWDISVSVGLLSLTVLAILKLSANHRSSQDELRAGTVNPAAATGDFRNQRPPQLRIENQ
jgi:hypothetical protein